MKYIHLIFAVMLLAINTSCAATTEDVKKPKVDEPQSTSFVSPIDNIGFVKNPPKALTERFPMCEEFLKVNWINKEKKIGYSTYGIYDRKGNRLESNVTALIDLDDEATPPRFDYDLTSFIQYVGKDVNYVGYRAGERVGLPKGGLDEIFTFIKDGYISRAATPLRIINQKNTKSITFRVIQLGAFTLANNQKTVCVPYPDNERMWIAEGKHVNKIYTEGKVHSILGELSKYISDDTLQFAHEGAFTVLDINFDGVEDYLLDKYVYSFAGRYYAMQPSWQSSIDKELGVWTLPPSTKKHQIGYGPFFMSSDGKSYFINNEFNITKALSMEGE